MPEHSNLIPERGELLPVNNESPKELVRKKRPKSNTFGVLLLLLVALLGILLLQFIFCVLPHMSTTIKGTTITTPPTTEPTHLRELTIHNRCPFDVYAAIRDLGEEIENPANGGFKLKNDEAKKVIVSPDWFGIIWPRRGCDTLDDGTIDCPSGGCGNKVECAGARGDPPFTTAELHLSADQSIPDTYKVTLEDGYNLPVHIDTFDGKGRVWKCGRAGGCLEEHDVLLDCPEESKLELIGGVNYGCRSPCEHLSEKECKEHPTTRMFKKDCPGMNAHKYDKTTLKCKKAKYLIQFC